MTKYVWSRIFNSFILLLFLSFALKAQTILVNAGGDAYTDVFGRSWSADTGFSSGSAFTAGGAIADTDDDTLYRTGRQDTSQFGYTFNVASGLYRLKLQWAEVQDTRANDRIFRVTAEGQTVFGPLDVRRRAAGADIAYILDVLVIVSDSQLNLNFVRISGTPFIQALDIQRVIGVPIDLATEVTGTLPAGNGGTGAGAFTQGSVVFAGASGVYTESNSGLFFETGTVELGIGTASPTNRLHVLKDQNESTRIRLENPDATGIIANAMVQVLSDAATLFAGSSGAGNTGVRLGETLGGWSEVAHISGSGLLVGTRDATPLILGTSNANRLEIASGGNVGIGLTLPGDELLHVGKAVDGALTTLLLENTQAHAGSSLNETVEIRFSFGGNNDVARIVVGKENDYDGAGEDDSFMAFQTDRDGTAAEAMRLTSRGTVQLVGFTQANLPAVADGNMAYCTDCLKGSDACSASSDGAVAMRVNGAWQCM